MLSNCSTGVITLKLYHWHWHRNYSPLSYLYRGMNEEGENGGFSFFIFHYTLIFFFWLRFELGYYLIYPLWILEAFRLDDAILECLAGNHHHIQMAPIIQNGQITFQPWIFVGRTDAEAEVPILWLPDAKSQLIGKDPDAGKDWRQEEKVTTEDKMVGWLHQLSGHKSEQALGNGEGQGSLACCSPWGHNELGTTEWLTIAITFELGNHTPRKLWDSLASEGGSYFYCDSRWT